MEHAEEIANISYEFNSDITSNDSQILILFCCCSKNTKEKGELYDLFSQKFPYADVYSIQEKDAIPGSIKAFGKKSEGQKIIVAIFSQLNYGEPSVKKDTAASREEWLNKALSKLFTINRLESVAFPYALGCGLNEEEMKAMRNTVIDYAKSYPAIKVVFVSGEDDPNGCISSEDEFSTCDEKEEECDDTITEERTIKEESDTETEDSDIPMQEKKDIKMKIQELDDFMKKKASIKKEVVNDTQQQDIPEEFYKWFWQEVQNLPYINPQYFLKMYRTSIGISQKISSQPAVVRTSIKKEMTWENATLLEFTTSNIPKGYEPFFLDFIKNEGGMCVLSSFLEKESKLYSLQPPLENIYKAFELCPLDKMKVIILGQDPYPTKGAAMGVAFGTNGRIQPSLRNIFTLLEKDGYKANGSSGDLGKWCNQGVFLLNTALTVREGNAGSHLAKKESGPWETFTRQLLRYLNEKIEKLVVILWGNHAKEYKKYFSEKHFIIQSSHPASSCYGGSSDFFDSMCFSKANRKLRVWKMQEIDWNLV